MEGEKEDVDVVFACMDHRLVPLLELLDDPKLSSASKKHEAEGLFEGADNESYKNFATLLDRIGQERVIVVANAGANLFGLDRTIEEIRSRYSVKGAFAITHFSERARFDEGCGGKKVIAAAIAQGMPQSDEIYGHFRVDRYAQEVMLELNRRSDIFEGFKHMKNSQQAEMIDEVHDRMLESALTGVSGNREVFRINTDHLMAHEGAHVYQITADAADIEVDRKIAVGKLKLVEGRTLRINEQPEPAGYSSRAQNSKKFKAHG